MPAAVLLAIVLRDPQPTVLITQRHREISYPGHWVFPGGRADPGDSTPHETALREAEEEIGLTADFVDVQHLSTALLAEVEPEIVRRHDIDFYEPRMRMLTPAEQDLLLTTASCPYPPLLAADIVAGTDKSTGNTNVLLGRIVKAGVMYRLRRGEYEYTAPRFHEFLQRRS